MLTIRMLSAPLVSSSRVLSRKHVRLASGATVVGLLSRHRAQDYLVTPKAVALALQGYALRLLFLPYVSAVDWMLIAEVLAERKAKSGK